MISIGYEAPASMLSGNLLDFSDRVRSLGAYLVGNQHLLGDGPLVFVAHSLGGVLVSSLMVQVLTHRWKDAHTRPHIERLVRRIRLVCLLGSPLAGARIADWMPGFLGSNLIKGLGRRGNGYLKDLHDDLHDLGVQGVPLPRFVAFTEGRRQWRLLTIVEPLGARPYVPNSIEIRLDGDHSTIAKPVRRDSIFYRRMTDELQALCDADALRLQSDIDLLLPAPSALGKWLGTPEVPDEVAMRRWLPRRWLLRRLRKEVARRTCGYIVLESNMKWGKSAFFHGWLIRWRQSRRRYAQAGVETPLLGGWVFGSQGPSQGEDDPPSLHHPGRLLLGLARRTAETCPELFAVVDRYRGRLAEPWTEDLFWEAFTVLVTSLGQALQPGRCAVLLLDDLDAALAGLVKYQPGSFTARLPKLPEGVHIILTRRVGTALDAVLRGAALSPPLTVIALQSRDVHEQDKRADMQQYLDWRLQDRVLPSGARDDIRALRSQLLTQAGGSAYVLQRFVGQPGEPLEEGKRHMLRQWARSGRQPPQELDPIVCRQVAEIVARLADRSSGGGTTLPRNAAAFLCSLAVLAALRESFVDESRLFEFLGAPDRRWYWAPAGGTGQWSPSESSLRDLDESALRAAYEQASELLGQRPLATAAAFRSGSVFALQFHRAAVRLAWQRVDELPPRPDATVARQVLFDGPGPNDPRWIFDGPTARVQDFLVACCEQALSGARPAPSAAGRAYALKWGAWHLLAAGRPRRPVLAALLADRRTRRLVDAVKVGPAVDAIESTLRQMWRRCLADASRGRADDLSHGELFRLSDVFFVLHNLEQRWERPGKVALGPPMDTVEAAMPLVGVGRRFLQMLIDGDRLGGPPDEVADIDDLLRRSTFRQLLRIVRYAVAYYETTLLTEVLERIHTALRHPRDARWLAIETYLVERGEYVARYALARVSASGPDAMRTLEALTTALNDHPGVGREEYSAYCLATLAGRRDPAVSRRAQAVLSRLAGSPYSATRLAVLHALLRLVPALDGELPPDLREACTRLAAVKQPTALEQDALRALGTALRLLRPDLANDADLAPLLTKAANSVVAIRAQDLTWQHLEARLRNHPFWTPMIDRPGSLPGWLRPPWLRALPPELLRKLLDADAALAIELFAFMLSHPLWEMAEAAATQVFDALTGQPQPLTGDATVENVLLSLINLAEGQSETDPTSHVAEGHRLLVGVIELAYLHGGGDPEHFSTLLLRHYAHEKVAVRGQLAENLVARVLQHVRVGRHPDDYLPYFREPLRHWMADPEPWVLEQMHRLVTHLPPTCAMRREMVSEWPHGVLPAGEWWRLSRAGLLEQIDARRAEERASRDHSNRDRLHDSLANSNA